MNLTPAARLYFKHIDRATQCALNDAEHVQKRILKNLIDYGRNTRWGREHHYGSINSYADYSSRVELSTYETLHDYIIAMVKGEKDILLPGRVDRFAQSSGTSDGKSKYIPLPHRSLQQCHYKGSSKVVARYLANNSDSRIFSGKSFILGGSYATELPPRKGLIAGDLSASLIDCINPVANLVRVPAKEIALMEHWEEKLTRLVEATYNSNVTNISGVPSWFYTVLKRILDRTGADNIHQVWPNLEVFFHGGIAFGPYRKQYDDIIDPARMNYMETYNASEGFFALQNDPDDRAMALLTDVDVFYEFVELDTLDTDGPRVHPLWEVERGRNYALAITSSNGLWRYLIGDTVEICSTDPLKIKISGRTRSYINAFGEELMVHNAEAAIAEACRVTGAEVADYTAAPVYADRRERGYHQWLIEFRRQPDTLEHFADVLDRRLQQVNSDYQAKRTSDIFLAPPQITPVKTGLFNLWLGQTGKLGGQRKVPRLKNDRSLADALLALQNSSAPDDCM